MTVELPSGKEGRGIAGIVCDPIVVGAKHTQNKRAFNEFLSPNNATIAGTTN